MLQLQNIEDAKNKLVKCNTLVFQNAGNSFAHYLNKIKVNNFRHLSGFEMEFNHPVTIISGTNRIGKTSLLLIVACSHENFLRYDATKPNSDLRRHTWRDVLSFTSYETLKKDYSYELFWRVGVDSRTGEGKRLASKQSWTGLGKRSKDKNRINAQIRVRNVRLIDLERLLPARNFSNSLMRKTNKAQSQRVNPDVERAFAYIMETDPGVEIYQIGSHVNKVAYLIKFPPASSQDSYSSYNAASGEESIINMLVDIFDTPNDSLILVDELEAGIHPYVQRRVADVIQYTSWTQKKQFIITTHSPSLLSAFPQASRKFIDRNFQGLYEVISSISVNTAFSKMDSKAYPLVQLYCEDTEAEFIIRNVLVEINKSRKHFDRLINIVQSGPVDQVRNDYERHKRNYPQLRQKLGFCCVFDGDYKNEPKYSHYFNNTSEHSFFLYPFTAPEKFLVSAYLKASPNVPLSTALNYSDHHSLFQEMTNLGLAANPLGALHLCWQSFQGTPEHSKLEKDLSDFLVNTVWHFSKLND